MYQEPNSGNGGESQTQAEINALRAEIAQLRLQATQQPTPIQMMGLQREVIADKSEKFKGKLGNAVKTWIAAWEA